MNVGQHVHGPSNLNKLLCEAADRRAPRECCGLLLGDRLNEALRISRWIETTNGASSHDSFRMDPRDYRRIEREVELRGQQILGVFHSHPAGLGKPSERDAHAVAALWGAESDWIYLICGLKERPAPRVRGWGWHNNAFYELNLLF